PPAFLNHRVPTACDTPAATAASSLAIPAAIATQNRRRSSRPVAGGRPGENRGARPDRSDRRFRSGIATSSMGVLRRPLESALHPPSLAAGPLPHLVRTRSLTYGKLPRTTRKASAPRM